MPHVGDVVTLDQQDKIFDFFDLADKELERRKDLFTDYAGSYNDYIQNSGSKLPLKVFIINNYDVFSETNANLVDKIQYLFRDGAKYGVVFIVTAISSNSIRTKTAQNFQTKICLKMSNTDDYRAILGVSKLTLADKFGRGFIKLDNSILEFQTASFAEKKDITNSLRELAKLLNESYTTRASKIPYIPAVVTLDNLVNKMDSDVAIPVGYSFITRDIYHYNLENNQILPIVSMNIDQHKMSFVFSLIKLLNYRLNNIKVIDFANAYTKPIDDIEGVKDNFDKTFVEIYNEIVKSKESSVNNYYIILGASYLKEKLEEKTYELISGLFKQISEYSNTYFILVDVYNGFKHLRMEEWYNSTSCNKNAIWLGEGFGSQVLFESQPLSSEEKKLDIPYMGISLLNGRAEFIKYVIDAEADDEK